MHAPPHTLYTDAVHTLHLDDTNQAAVEEAAGALCEGAKALLACIKNVMADNTEVNQVYIAPVLFPFFMCWDQYEQWPPAYIHTFPFQVLAENPEANETY